MRLTYVILSIVLVTPVAGCSGCPTALLEGTLVANSSGGLAVQAPEGGIVTVHWPSGVGVGHDGDQLVLTNPLGQPIAHQGEFVSMAGGRARGLAGIRCVRPDRGERIATPDALGLQHTDWSVGLSGRSLMARNEGKSATQAERSRARREQILDAAFHTFTRRGYRDTAVDEIAAAADTSKGGVYFHFPTKEAIFRELMRTTADRLADKVERAVAQQTEPIARADAALRTVLLTFAGHRTMARLLFVDAMGAGRVFNAETNALHDRFAAMIAGYLDDAVAAGTIPPIDTGLTGVAWFGALNEVVARWLLVDDPEPLESVYPTLRALLLRSVGVPEARIADQSAMTP